MAYQARHEMDAPQELCAPRYVVPQPLSQPMGEGGVGFHLLTSVATKINNRGGMNSALL